MNWVLRRTVGVSVMAVLTMSALVGGISIAQAQESDSKGAPGRVSLDVVDASLSTVVMMLTRESKQDIIIADPDIKNRVVSATITDKPLESVLKRIVESAGCSLSKGSDGVYVIRGAASKTAAVDATTPATDDTASVKTPVPTINTPVPNTRLEKIALYNTNPVDLMWALGLYTLDEAALVTKMTHKPGVYMRHDDGSMEPVSVPKQHTPTMSETMKSGMPSREANRTTAVGDEAHQGIPPGYPGSTSYRPPSASPSSTTSSTSTTNTQGLMPPTVTYVMPYELDNSLLVRGDEEGIAEMKNIISMLDIAPKQISIKAEFVSISTSDINNLGINWAVDRFGTSFSTNFSPAGNVALGIASGNVLMNLQAEITKSNGKLINAPLVTTINNVAATISFETSVPYENTTTIYNTTGVPTTSSYVDTIDVASQLWVLPRVNNADNSITVQVSPQISDITGSVPGSTSGSSLPIVDRQMVSTIRRVANGETIVLGGLIRKDDKESVNKIPLLGDLPLIGRFFRNTANSTDDKELLILLTPSIVPEKPVAGSGIGVIP